MSDERPDVFSLGAKKPQVRDVFGGRSQEQTNEPTTERPTEPPKQRPTERITEPAGRTRVAVYLRASDAARVRRTAPARGINAWVTNAIRRQLPNIGRDDPAPPGTRGTDNLTLSIPADLHRQLVTKGERMGRVSVNTLIVTCIHLELQGDAP